MSTTSNYPWFQLVEGTELEQGDILEQYPVFSPPSDLPIDLGRLGDGTMDFHCRLFNLVVITQSCDLTQGKSPEVLLCPVWEPADYKEGELSKPSRWEDARKGRFPAYHVINRCEIPGFEREPRIVDFRQVYTLPFSFVPTQAALRGRRLRLMPPYREHLAQAFARLFMRVGLPVDIPPFR